MAIEGDLDVALLEHAIRFVVSRTASMRATLVTQGSQASQRILGAMHFAIEHVDFRSDSNPQEAAMQWMSERRRHCIAASDAPLFRFALLRLASDMVYFYGQYHHIAIDALGQTLFNDRDMVVLAVEVHRSEEHTSE